MVIFVNFIFEFRLTTVDYRMKRAKKKCMYCTCTYCFWYGWISPKPFLDKSRSLFSHTILIRNCNQNPLNTLYLVVQHWYVGVCRTSTYIFSKDSSMPCTL